MRLEPINIVCPACGNPNYTRRIIGEHDEYYNAKCLNCNSYFNFKEIFAETSDGKDIKATTPMMTNANPTGDILISEAEYEKLSRAMLLAMYMSDVLDLLREIKDGE